MKSLSRYTFNFLFSLYQNDSISLKRIHPFYESIFFEINQNNLTDCFYISSKIHPDETINGITRFHTDKAELLNSFDKGDIDNYLCVSKLIAEILSGKSKKIPLESIMNAYFKNKNVPKDIKSDGLRTLESIVSKCCIVHLHKKNKLNSFLNNYLKVFSKNELVPVTKNIQYSIQEHLNIILRLLKFGFYKSIKTITVDCVLGNLKSVPVYEHYLTNIENYKFEEFIALLVFNNFIELIDFDIENYGDILRPLLKFKFKTNPNNLIALNPFPVSYCGLTIDKYKKMVEFKGRTKKFAKNTIYMKLLYELVSNPNTLFSVEELSFKGIFQKDKSLTSKDPNFVHDYLAGRINNQFKKYNKLGLNSKSRPSINFQDDLVILK